MSGAVAVERAVANEDDLSQDASGDGPTRRRAFQRCVTAISESAMIAARAGDPRSASRPGPDPCGRPEPRQASRRSPGPRRRWWPPAGLRCGCSNSRSNSVSTSPIVVFPPASRSAISASVDHEPTSVQPKSTGSTAMRSVRSMTAWSMEIARQRSNASCSRRTKSSSRDARSEASRAWPRSSGSIALQLGDETPAPAAGRFRCSRDGRRPSDSLPPSRDPASRRRPRPGECARSPRAARQRGYSRSPSPAGRA